MNTSDLAGLTTEQRNEASVDIDSQSSLQKAEELLKEADGHISGLERYASKTAPFVQV
jgi:hypothetical protein